MGLITTVISIATEEITPVGLAVVSKGGTSGEQFGLTVTTTSRTATTENRQVSWATVVNTVVETDTWAREDAVTYSSITDETCDPICTPIFSETTESSTATGEENTRVWTFRLKMWIVKEGHNSLHLPPSRQQRRHTQEH